MNAWATLVASALVGTDRQSPAINFTDPALTSYQSSLQHQSATQQILGAVSLVSAYQTAGQNAATGIAIPAAADPEQLACCTPQTTQYLGTILAENRYADILPELLQLIAEAQQTVPAAFLPLLLDAGYRNKQLRPLILPILGSLGQWLARQNRQWEYGLGAKAAEVDLAVIQDLWATGSRSERSAALSQWRALQPAEARQALFSGWKQEKAEDRAVWLGILQVGLSMADEEFLELALADRSKAVNQQAAQLLAQLPSKYNQRFTELVSKCLVVKNIQDVYQIELHLPSAWPDIAINPLINSSLGTVDRQFIHALSVTDLSIWPGAVDKLIAAVLKIDQKLLILKGWALAAYYQQRLDWATALLAQADAVLDYEDMQRLWQDSPDAKSQQERFFTGLLNADDFLDKFQETFGVMMSAERHWSQSVSSLALQKFDQVVQLTNNYYLPSLSIRMANHLDITVLPALQQRQAAFSSGNFSYNGCVEILELRHQIHQEFNTE
jgi:Family of unknown function (DUF5691)